MRKKMVSNYGVILRQIGDGKGVFCYNAFFFFFALKNERGSCMFVMTGLTLDMS